jgi:hypothetical protein
MMPIRFLILRLVIALLCVGFAYFWGRSVAQSNMPHRRGAGPMAWAIRTLVAAAAIQWGAGPDVFSIVVYSAVVASWGGGFALSRRPPEPEEDLTKDIFPDSDD